MNKRSAIFSETEFFTRDRRRDPEAFRKKKREKSLEELEKESEDKLLSQLYYMNALYNQGESTIKNDTQITEFIIELLKESILSERQDINLFKGIKRQKRRYSFSLTQEISVNQYIDSLNISMQQSAHHPSLISFINNNTTKANVKKEEEGHDDIDNNYCADNVEEEEDDDGLNGMSAKPKPIQKKNYFNNHYIYQSLAQNIISEDNIRVMFVSNNNDVITRSMIWYFIYNNDSFQNDTYSFTIKNKIYQLNSKKTIKLTLYDTKMPFHYNQTCQSYYLYINFCIFFINNNQNSNDSLNEVKTIFNNISNANKSTRLITISNVETPIYLKEKIQLISDAIIQFEVDSSDEFNRIVLHKLITNYLLRKAPIKKSLDDDDYTYAISDDLNCGSAYSMDDRNSDDEDDEPDCISKFGRSKSIR